MYVFTATFNQLNASLLNKQSFIFKNSSCKIIWEIFDFILRSLSSDCTLSLGKSEYSYTIEENHARLLEDYKIVFLSGEKSERQEDPSVRLLS